jgi:phosphate transport system substrate-binding protein
MKDYKIYIIFIILLLLSGCKGVKRNSYAETPTSGTIRIGVDETFKPIVNAELMVFLDTYQDARITPSYISESEAFNDLFEDSARLIIVSRSLNNKEKDYFKQKKLFPREAKIAEDAIALIVNPANNDTLITISELKSVLTGEWSEWRQLDPRSELKRIDVVFDNKNSGTIRYAVDSICKGAKLSGHLFALDSNLDVVNYVSNNLNALGFIGVSWISNHNDSTQLSFLKRIRVVALSKEENATQDNSYQPYQAYIFDGSYPLSRFIYAINTEPRNGLATGFMTFLASDRGQRIILRAGIVPATIPVRLIKITDEW